MVTQIGVPLDHLERATPIVSGFLLGYVAAIPIFGPLSDARGRSAAYLGALGLFAVGSVVTAGADELNRLIAGRAIQGFAGGALVPVSLAVVADLFPERAARGLALGAAAAAQEIGSLAGPVYGAAVSQWAAAAGGWRAVFWLNVPLAALCAGWFLVAARGVPAVRAQAAAAVSARGGRGGKGGRGGRATGPVAGVVLGAGMALLVVALYPTDAARGLFNAHFAPLLAAALVLVVLFVVLEGRAGLFARAPVPAAVNFVVGIALVGALAEVPVLATTLLGLDQTGAALLLARFLLGVPIGALLGGWLLRLDGRLPAAAGMALSAVCYWQMSGWGGAVSAEGLVLFGCGLGFGLVIAPVVGALVDAASGDEHGAAAGAAVLARTAGMVVGIALLAAYGFHRFYGDLARCPAHTVFGIQTVDVRCATAALRAQYHDVFLLAAGACVIAALLSLLLDGARRPL